MPIRLILNADDFGLTRGVNRAIVELHAAGALTEATLMARGPAFDDAVTLTRAHPALRVGCHIVLTDGVPVSPLGTIPTLLGPDGRSFRPSLHSFILAVLSGRVDPLEVAREAQAQIESLQNAGIDVTHIDTHKHTHLFPRIARPLLEAAERCGVPAIRNPFEPAWSRELSPDTMLRGLQVRLIHYLRPRFMALPQIRSGTVQTTDGTLGVSATGQLNAASLHSLLNAMPEGVWELVCHPGYNDRDLDAVTTRLRQTREIEREALLGAFTEDSSNRMHRPQIELISYKQAQSQV